MIKIKVQILNIYIIIQVFHHSLVGLIQNFFPGLVFKDETKFNSLKIWIPSDSWATEDKTITAPVF